MRRLSLQTQFLLVLILGAILPLGLLGLWLNRSAERSGQTLVRQRLERDLAQIVEEVGLRWVRYRSELLSLGEHPAVQQMLRLRSTGRPLPHAVRARAAGMADVADELVLRDSAGGEVWRLGPLTGQADPTGRVITALVPITLEVYDGRTGIRLGALGVQLRVSALLPGGAGWVGVGGSVLGIFDRNSGTSLLPLTIDPAQFRRPRFVWADEPWITARQTLSEPPLDIVLAAPLGPITDPFAEAARRGTVALVGVVLAAVLLVSAVTGGLTGSLGRLAATADAVTRGDLHRRVAEGSSDEVARVARAFNAMTESLQRTLRELSHRESLAAVGEFAASLAHEVRNPLTAVRVDLQRADERVSDPDARELIRRTLRTVDRLDATVSGALRIARSGKVVQRPLDLRVPLNAAMEGAKLEFAARGAVLEPLCDAAGDVTVMGDSAALEQLFLNLLLNAAQALSTGGQAGINVEPEPTAVTVLVWDTGPGIPAELRKRVFEPFFSTRPDGTGLGLAIAQRIAAAHGGEVTMDSTPGTGTIVKVRLRPATESGRSP